MSGFLYRRDVRRTVRAATAITTAMLLAACGDDPVRPAHLNELNRAFLATEKYKDIALAVADGYVDAKIVTQSMGHHYLNATLLDDRFEVERPELLVYAPVNGRMELVGVEYAVPLDKSATAPGGFTGTEDAWERSTKYGLWTLHAWIWRKNVDGVFAPMNPGVQLDPTTIEGTVHAEEH
jgi:hypothetical protein